MEIYLDINDELITRARRHSKRTGRPLGALVEDGLRQVLSTNYTREKYELPDLSVGNPDSRDPLEAHSWQNVRELIYGDSEAG